MWFYRTAQWRDPRISSSTAHYSRVPHISILRCGHRARARPSSFHHQKSSSRPKPPPSPTSALARWGGKPHSFIARRSGEIPAFRLGRCLFSPQPTLAKPSSPTPTPPSLPAPPHSPPGSAPSHTSSPSAQARAAAAPWSHPPAPQNCPHRSWSAARSRTKS